MGKASRKKRVRRPRGELIERLEQQLRFLSRSAAAFDGGDEAEASRLAVTIRVMVHDTKTSTSLLRSLKLDRKTKFLDTGSELYVSEPQPDGNRKDQILLTGSALTQVETSSAGLRVLPLLGDLRSHQERWCWFRSWWTRSILTTEPGRLLFGGIGRTASRRDVVLWLANEDGGAHVDEELDAFYDEFVHQYRAVFHINDERPPTPLRAAIRQIAYEVTETFRTHGVIGDPAAVDLRSEG